MTETDGQVKSKEVQHAEKIYATLRECREQVGLKKNKGIKMQGYLNKKSEKTKKWKSMYFVLLTDGADTHLYFYDNPKVSAELLLSITLSALSNFCHFFFSAYET